MEYRRSFKEFLEICKDCGQTYVGHGNPNADVLIVANEPGTDDPYLIEYDLNRNLELWTENDKQQQGMDTIREMFDANHNPIGPMLNPLWPFKGQHFVQIKTKQQGESKIILNDNKQPTSRNWIQYQKLIDMIYNPNHECVRGKQDPLDFFKRAFITDLSAIYGKHSKDIDAEMREDSITKRLPMFKSSFICSFPVIIVASGHYIRDIAPLKDLRKVFPGFNRIEMINDGLGWRNIHYSEDCEKRILIHTKHFASAIKDDYLKEIAQLCSRYIVDR